MTTSSRACDAAASSALPGLQYGDALDVVRHRERVPRLERDEPVAVCRSGLDVARERRRIARDIDDSARSHPGEQTHDVLAGPCARRVEHREVGGDVLSDEGPQLA